MRIMQCRTILAEEKTARVVCPSELNQRWIAAVLRLFVSKTHAVTPNVVVRREVETG